jgi:hypothetical protein
LHFDPATSQEPSSAPHSSRVTSTDLIEPDPEREEESAPRNREGLPPAFRMRHGRHYVEQLMGDAPLRTVKEIPVADIEPPPADTVDLQDLEQSIRRLGVLEPLLVSKQEQGYRVIAGMNRLRAARAVGLRTVPCLVHDVDEEMLKNMREAARQRAIPPSPEPAMVEAPREVPLPPAFSEVTAGLKFVSALMPAITAAGDDRFRWSVLTDLAGVELLRARTVAAVAETLANDPVPNRVEVSCEQLAGAVVSAVAPEARLRGVRLDVRVADPGYKIALDASLVTSGITGLVQSVMALLPAAGAAVRINIMGTTVRPALIVQLSQEVVDLGGEAGSRFFDGNWRQHPAGPTGGLLLAGAARIARLHGGRVDVQPLPATGCTLTFVIPKAFEDSGSAAAV